MTDTPELPDTSATQPTPVPWHLRPMAAIDTETTGLSPQTGDRVIELGVVAFDNGEVTDRWSVLLDPQRPLDPDVTRLTGIKPEELEGQPTFADVVPQLLEKLAGRLLVAYNASFDRTFLIAEFSRAGAQLPRGARWLDPLVFAKELQKGQGNHKLGTVAKRLGVPLEEAHRAAADAECAGWVLQKLAEQLPADFDELVDLHEKWEGEQEFERSQWKARARGRQTGQVQTQGDGLMQAQQSDLPANALGPTYAYGDELDPVRFMILHR